jgi:hypothetical protein
VSSEPGCSRDQKQPCPDDDGSDGSRDALTGRCETFDGDGCRHDSHRAKVHDPDDQEDRPVLAFLADGKSWSSSALALALGASQRTVQRALDSLAAAGEVQSFGRGRSRRWMTPPVPGFTTTLLLPAPRPLH